MIHAKRMIAAAEILLIFPAALFMTALFVRNLQPLQYQPARAAQSIVAWYAARPHIGLWVLLIALPLAVLITGLTALYRAWRKEPDLRDAARRTAIELKRHWATLVTAAATCAAGLILAIVALHVLTD